VFGRKTLQWSPGRLIRRRTSGFVLAGSRLNILRDTLARFFPRNASVPQAPDQFAVIDGESAKSRFGNASLLAKLRDIIEQIVHIQLAVFDFPKPAAKAKAVIIGGLPL
jgi:hypothetical protein